MDFLRFLMHGLNNINPLHAQAANAPSHNPNGAEITPAGLAQAQQFLQQHHPMQHMAQMRQLMPTGAQMAQMGNQYVQNPTAPQFNGVDPRQFGFPPDATTTGSQIPAWLGSMGANGRFEPSAQAVAPDSVLFHPQVQRMHDIYSLLYPYIGGQA